MRCPSCTKFVSYDEPVVEVNDTSVDGETVTGQVRLVLPCSECGEELKDMEFEIEAEITHDCPDLLENGKPSYEIESEWEGEPTDRYKYTIQSGKNRGKKIKSYRYMKHYYGAELTASVKCNYCEDVIKVSANCEEQASAFNELV